ncbi:oxidoreductase [Dacryopinax primogenitus]|uniref:Oxidoreductase n=1 Tax=Dacryopinax primogenitus (strain DJM 731) TaxID=1858805 RepID=M5FRW6_DACPD|nr:oxidoreductase [Dacryopinax primogenitus]EJT99990.1 oxidoreductase [Dacryopinax primogenitus]
MPSIQDSPVPVIDFGLFLNATSPQQRKQVAEQVFHAFRTVGFVYLINHGIPVEMMDDAFAWSKRFFDLPLEEKMKCPHPPSGEYHRGYSGIGKEKVSQMVFDKEKLAELRKAPDVKESFESGSEADTKYPNLWPDPAAISGFREFCVKYFTTARQTQMEVMHAIALGMGIDENFFDIYHTDSTNQLRLLHYPPVEESALRGGEKERIGAHSDFGTLTMLSQDDCGGLEVEDPHHPGIFSPAPPIRGALIVNIGDFLMRWSNDVLKSTLHRVRAPPVKDTDKIDALGATVRMTPPRYSIPYFCSANRDTVIDCIPGCWSETVPKKYEPITAGEYIAMRMNVTY